MAILGFCFRRAGSVSVAAGALLAITTSAWAATTTQTAPTFNPLKAASCGAKGAPKQCSAGEKCVSGRCVPDPKGPKTGPIEKR
ncbi:MAG: hypothetical protein R3E48_03550 [Burkholderiaceae bacterium]